MGGFRRRYSISTNFSDYQFFIPNYQKDKSFEIGAIITWFNNVFIYFGPDLGINNITTILYRFYHKIISYIVLISNSRLDFELDCTDCSWLINIHFFSDRLLNICAHLDRKIQNYILHGIPYRIQSSILWEQIVQIIDLFAASLKICTLESPDYSWNPIAMIPIGDCVLSNRIRNVLYSTMVLKVRRI